MTIRRKAKKSALNEFVAMIVPDRIEEAYGRVETYFDEHLNLSFDSPQGVSGVIDELIRQNGEPVRNALYNLLCEPESAMRTATQTALGGGGVSSAVGVLVPLLVAQFAMAPAVALLVGTLVIKAFASSGEKAVCEELAQQHRKAARRLREAEQKKVERERPKIPRRTVKRKPEYREEPSSTAGTRVRPATDKPTGAQPNSSGIGSHEAGKVRRSVVKSEASEETLANPPEKGSRRHPVKPVQSPPGDAPKGVMGRPAEPKGRTPSRKPQKSG